jgi:hypothetical protein
MDRKKKDQAVEWRAKADECRSIAATLSDPEARATFMQMAESYVRRAELREGAPSPNPAKLKKSR